MNSCKVIGHLRATAPSKAQTAVRLYFAGLRSIPYNTAASVLKLAPLVAAIVISVPATAQSLLVVPETSPIPDVLAPVLYAYATLAKQQTTRPMCWQVLVPQSQVLLREHNAKPWLLRNLTPIVGAVMGGIVGGLLLKHHASAIVAKRLAIPVVAGSGAAGYFVGPGGVAGFVVGGAIGEKLGKRKLPITIASAAGGALVGKMLWEMVFPPDLPAAPSDGPDDDIPVEVFVREQMCGAGVQTTYNQSLYRVGYQFDGKEVVAEVPYDPGEALLLDSSGKITGPARLRID